MQGKCQGIWESFSMHVLAFSYCTQWSSCLWSSALKIVMVNLDNQDCHFDWIEKCLGD
jgi:hypothetical protein